MTLRAKSRIDASQEVARLSPGLTASLVIGLQKVGGEGGI
jgi:hypothetical protein